MVAHDAEEAALLDIFRRSRGSPREQPPIPILSVDDFDLRMRTKLALGSADTRHRTITKLRRISNVYPENARTVKYPGPLVDLRGTVDSLAASWISHVEDLIGKQNASGPVVRHHREAVERYVKCAGIDWRPETSKFEKRSLTARSARSQNIQLPEDFVDLLHEIVNGVTYHKDPAYNETVRHAARLAAYTAPRFPSELARLKTTDVRMPRADTPGGLTYYVSKLGGIEREPILIPREVFGLSPGVLTWPRRRSYATYLNTWRPKLLNRALHRGLTRVDPGNVFLGLNGMPVDPESLRQDLSLGAKTVWPDFYPYMLREVGIIMRYLEIVQAKGHPDIEELAQWSDHVKWDNLRRYTRKGRSILREYKPGPELDELLAQWRQI